MESYQETIQFLYSLQLSGIKLGLENVTRLLAFLGNPQQKWPAIHIAGTNGKGSTATFIYSILQEAGYRTGLYTSPHLVDFSERIRINEKLIDWSTIVEYTRDMKSEIEKNNATFFEATTAIAFHYFAEQNVDVGVIETGLGGRLDATNLTDPLVTVITSVSFDHMQYLGESLREIAHEKAGIIKTGIPCVTNNSDQEVLEELSFTCQQKNSPLSAINFQDHIEIIEQSLKGSRFILRLSELQLGDLNISLAGKHQILNAALAVLAVNKAGSLNASEINIRHGLEKARWPGRLQVITSHPLTLLDVAHNPDGFLKIFSFLSENCAGRPIWAIVGLSRGKDSVKIADTLLKHTDRIAIVDHFSERGLESEKLIDALGSKGGKAILFPQVDDAYQNFQYNLPVKGIILIIGSHYLAGEFLKKIQFS
jgi:dihydrofolate synthase/folylpolyglutamate synthase